MISMHLKKYSVLFFLILLSCSVQTLNPVGEEYSIIEDCLIGNWEYIDNENNKTIIFFKKYDAYTLEICDNTCKYYAKITEVNGNLFLHGFPKENILTNKTKMLLLNLKIINGDLLEVITINEIFLKNSIQKNEIKGILKDKKNGIEILLTDSSKNEGMKIKLIRNNQITNAPIIRIPR